MTKSRGVYFKKGTQKDTICSVPGCTHEVVCKNLCNAHYLRAKRGKEFFPAVQGREETSRPCLVENCANPVSQKGGKDLCPKHFKRYLTRTRKEILVSLLGGKCIKCSVAFPPAVFDFHHRNPEEKSFGIGSELTNKSMDELLEEVKKCDLLCANCHRVLHYGGF